MEQAKKNADLAPPNSTSTSHPPAQPRNGEASAGVAFDAKPDAESRTSLNASEARKLPKARPRSRRKPNASAESEEDSAKRRCVSTACIACRKRKSKCDGNLPACAACSQVYSTACVYDPNSDHRRKGVYRNEFDNLKTRGTTLQTLVQAILNYAEDEVPDLIREIRTCESLDAVADRIMARDQGADLIDTAEDENALNTTEHKHTPQTFEQQLSGRLGDLRMDEGSVRYIGGTSNFIHLTPDDDDDIDSGTDEYAQQESPITSWTEVTDDPELVVHLLNMYFTWHYTYFTTLSKTLFYRDFLLGRPPPQTKRKTHYCTPLLVNAILALGCHFTSHHGAREDPDNSATAGDHFFREAKRLIMANDEHEKPRLTTVQALALMSVREAGCGREAKGWVYSGMSFRMACDMGLNLDSGRLTVNKHINGDEAEEDVRRITFWGCYLFDKCWSNYLGRLPQLPATTITAAKPEVFPDEDAAQWVPYTDSGFTQSHAQPARTRAVALQITKLCEISDDLMRYFYHPSDLEKTKGKAAELKKLSDIHTRLEAWRRELPGELEPREGGLSSVLVMHMFFQLLFIHLFRPFLEYTHATSPLPSNVSPRRLCTQAAATISKLMRLYKRSHGLRQICNIAVYIAHSACTIHLLNLPDKNAKRDITHGLKHLEEIAEGWLCARRTLGVLSVLARKWNVQLPDEATAIFARTDVKYASYVAEVSTPGLRQTPETTAGTPNAADEQPRLMWRTPDLTSVPSALAGIAPWTPGPPLPSTTHSRTPFASEHSKADVPTTTGQFHRDRSAISPSVMFGGVEQLIRDSSNWVYEDQAQYASGFGNWHGSLDTESTSSAWAMTEVTNGMRPMSGASQSSLAAHNNILDMYTAQASTATPTLEQGPMGNVNQRTPALVSSLPQTTSYAAAGLVAAGPNNVDLNAWMNGMGNLPAYDEAEWYR